MDPGRIKLFDSFDHQIGGSSPHRLHLTETISYCEARFRAILSAFGRASHPRQRVIQRGLHKELVSGSSYD